MRRKLLLLYLELQHLFEVNVLLKGCYYCLGTAYFSHQIAIQLILLCSWLHQSSLTLPTIFQRHNYLESLFILLRCL